MYIMRNATKAGTANSLTLAYHSSQTPRKSTTALRVVSSEFCEQHTKVLPNTNTLDWSGSNYSTHSSNYSTHSSNCFNHSFSNGMSSRPCALSSRRLYSLLIYGLVLWYTHPSLIMHSCNRGQSHIPLLQRFQVTAHRHHATTTLLLEATETIHCTLTSCWRETLRDT